MADMTPEQWRDRLIPKLASQALEVSRLRMWADGPHPWPSPPEALRAVLLRLCELAETNLCGLAVDAVAERLAVDGVRGMDPDQWRKLWQGNNLDADSTIAHADALTTKSSYLLVTPRDGEDPEITVEDPAECIVAYEPGSRRRRVAALKRFDDLDADESVCTVWTESEVVTWRRPYAHVGPDREAGGGWVEHEDMPRAANRLGVVPMVEMRCEGELGHKVITTNRRLNMTMFRILSIGEFQIVPQKYAIGITVRRDATGAPINPLKVGPEHVWILDADDPSKASVGQLEPADITPLMNLLDRDVTRFGAITKTPLYYVAGGLVNVSADAIRAAEAGLIAKVKRRQLTFGEAWEEAMRLGLMAMRLDAPAVDAAPVDLEVVWADPETRSLAERADASLKLNQAGYPFAAVARKMGETDTEIERLKVERAEERASFPLPAAPAA